MSNVPVELDYLENWLLTNGYAEERGGYGHVDAGTLAHALIDEFDIYRYIPKDDH